MEAFSVRQAIGDGVPRSRLRRRDLRADFHGARIPAEAPDDLLRRCASLQTLLDERHAFTGVTAALLWQMPLPRRLEQAHLFVATSEPGRAIRHRCTIGSERPSWWRSSMLGDLRVHEPAEVLASLAMHLELHDLVAVAEHIVTPTRRRPELAQLTDLAAFVRRCRGMTGVGRLRSALARTRVGARSRPETLVRLLLEDAGIPEAQINARLVLRSGREVFPDLSWPAYRIALEYDGHYHRDADQFERDVLRTDELVDEGWHVVHVVASQLFRTPSDIVARVTQRLASRGAPTRSVTRFPIFEP